MKIKDGVRKLKGRPAEIPDCGRDDLPEFFKEMGFTVGVEVGVYKGDYSKVLCESGLKVYSVDPWMSMPRLVHPRGQKRQDTIYQIAKKTLKPYKNNTIIRKTSMEAVEDFENESLDFVYIDGNHYFKYVAEDMIEWGYRLKKGGVLCGHDYAYFKHRDMNTGCQVREIVDAFAKSFDLNFWVLGRRKVRPGEVRDQLRSWMFIKTW